MLTFTISARGEKKITVAPWVFDVWLEDIMGRTAPRRWPVWRTMALSEVAGTGAVETGASPDPVEVHTCQTVRTPLRTARTGVSSLAEIGPHRIDRVGCPHRKAHEDLQKTRGLKPELSGTNPSRHRMIGQAIRAGSRPESMDGATWKA